VALGITKKTVFLFGGLGIAAVAMTGLFVAETGQKALIAESRSYLSIVGGEKKDAVGAFLDGKRDFVAALAKAPEIRDLLDRVAEPDVARSTQDALLAKLNAQLKPWAETMDSVDLISILHPRTGQVIASSHPSEVGKLKENRAYYRDGLTDPNLGSPYYSLTNRRPVMYGSAPVRGADNAVVDVLALRIDFTGLSRVLSRGLQQFATIDAFLVNKEHLYVTQPRLMKETAVLRTRNESPVVRGCLSGRSGLTEGINGFGSRVFADFRWLAPYQMCLITEVGEDEILRPVETMQVRIALFTLLTALAAAILAVVLARRLGPVEIQDSQTVLFMIQASFWRRLE